MNNKEVYREYDSQIGTCISSILIAVVPTIDQLISTKDLSFRRLSKRNTNVQRGTVLYTENTLHWRKIEVINSPLLI